MKIVSTKEAVFLFIGDVLALVLALIFALIVRYSQIPSGMVIISHLIPFSFLFAVSVLIYFVAGLYEKRTLVLRRRIPQTLINVQIANAIIAIAFFYFLPYFDITPKFFLFIYLLIALILTTIWRISAVALFETKRKQSAILIARKAHISKKGVEIKNEAADIYNEINNNPRYGITFVDWIDTSDLTIEQVKNLDILKHIQEKGITFVAADLTDRTVHPIVPSLYKLLFSGVEFVDTRTMYEDLFNRIPLSLVDDAWCLENISAVSKTAFDAFKRFMDISVALVLGAISLIVYPFVYLVIKLDDKGVLFSYQQRVGERGKIVQIMKFRTMSIANDDGKWQGAPKVNVVTRAGKFLRKSRIDELPQLWNVLKGDISLIGPRQEFPDAVNAYSAKIPYYDLRHIVKPGLSGWAQIYHEKHPHHGIDAEETANKLSYDLFYIKNRSIFLDIKIALQTMKVLLSFAGK